MKDGVSHGLDGVFFSIFVGEVFSVVFNGECFGEVSESVVVGLGLLSIVLSEDILDYASDAIVVRMCYCVFEALLGVGGKFGGRRLSRSCYCELS